MSEADTPDPAGREPSSGRAERAAESPPRTVVRRTAAGGVVRWDAPEADEIAETFPGLKVRELCGVGGMGAVYRAEQASLGRAVAVKVLPAATGPEPEARERFEREARILSALNHPHVLRVHDFGALRDGTLYIVTEWAGGGDLAKLLDGKPQPIAQVQQWVRQIASALGAAHARGIIHRDLKPANVLVLDDGRLTLGDFGLAHATGGPAGPLTTAGSIFGTFEYMAPEQMESAGKATPATDLDALGVIIYQMLTGRVPRGAYTRASRLVPVPVEVDAFLDATLATDPERRPQDAAEFVRLFDRACRAPQRRRHRQLIGLGVLLIVAALVWARVEVSRAEQKAAEAEARMRELMRVVRPGAAGREAPTEPAPEERTAPAPEKRTEPAP